MSDVGVVHVTAAVVALSAGAAVLVSRKGTRRHQRLGHLYVWSLVSVNGTSFMLTGLFGRFGPFHVLAALSLATLSAGMLPALLRRPRGTWLAYHARFMAWSYAGLAAAAAAEAAVRLPRVPFTTGAIAASGAVVAASALLIHGRGEALVRRAIRSSRRVALPWILLLSAATGMPAQDRSSDMDIALGQLARDLDVAVLKADTTALLTVLTALEDASVADVGLALHYVGYGRYRLAELLPAEQSGRRNALRSAARAALERSAETVPLGETHALLALLTGLEIARKPWSGPWLGRRWSRELKRAAKVAPGNPRVELLTGVAAYHAPRAFGGGLDRASRHLLRAIEAFTGHEARPPYPTWGRAEAHAWLGRVRESQGRAAEAREWYLRALEISPEYAWPERLLGRPATSAGDRASWVVGSPCCQGFPGVASGHEGGAGSGSWRAAASPTRIGPPSTTVP